MSRMPSYHSAYLASATPRRQLRRATIFPRTLRNVALRQAAPRPVAQALCLMCLAPDRLAIQPRKNGHDFWSTEVCKMLKAYAAP